MPSKLTRDNASVFATRIMELRKDRGISQKQAAKELGISQALLSHYENGVRECGLNFVVRAANYYNVSCDFLLGNSRSTVNLDRSAKITDIPDDKNMTTDTIVRAALAVGNKSRKDKELMDYIVQVFGISTYLVLYAGIKRGAVSATWANENIQNPDVASYLAHSLGTATHNLKRKETKETKEKCPACLDTVTSWTNDFLNISVASLL